MGDNSMTWGILHDLPLEPRDLLDDPSELSQQLAGLACALPPSTPLLVCGDWGSGKTSLLLRMQRRMEEDVPEGAKVPTVLFNAWHHEGEDSLLPALMRQVWLAAPTEYRAKAAARQGFGKLWAIAKAIGLRALPLIAPQVAVAAGVAVAAKDGMKDLEEGAKALLGDAHELPTLSLEVIEMDPVAALRKRFRDLVEGAWPKAVPTVFIDDLDRCSPAGAVALVDAIKTLVHHGEHLGCRFVVAVDKSVVVRAISKKFEHIDGYDGNRYLE